MIPRLLLLAGTACAVLSGGAFASPKNGEPAKERPGPGDKRRIIGVLEVRIDGVPKEIARQFQQDLEKQLDSREYWLAPQQRLKDLMAHSTKWTEGCVIGPCLQEVRTQTNVEVVLLAAISGADTTFGYVVSLVRTDTGKLIAQEASRCDVCTVNEALASATLAAVTLVTSLPDTLPDEAAEASAALDLATGKVSAEHAATKAHHRKLGIWLTVAGVVASGVGTTLYFAFDREGAGAATAGLGGGLLLGGVATLTF